MFDAIGSTNRDGIADIATLAADNLTNPKFEEALQKIDNVGGELKDITQQLNSKLAPIQKAASKDLDDLESAPQSSITPLKTSPEPE